MTTLVTWEYILISIYSNFKFYVLVSLFRPLDPKIEFKRFRVTKPLLKLNSCERKLLKKHKNNEKYLWYLRMNGLKISRTSWIFWDLFLEKYWRTWGKVQSGENSRARSGYLKNSLKDSNQWMLFISVHSGFKDILRLPVIIGMKKSFSKS